MSCRPPRLLALAVFLIGALSTRAAPVAAQDAGAAPAAGAAYVGSQACATCHAAELAAWRGSHHERAMQEANATTVLGGFDGGELAHRETTARFLRRDDKFFVHTDGPDGVPADFQVRYTFGVEPLQQYLIELPGGRLQATLAAWDSRPQAEGGQRWFRLSPEEKIVAGDVLHWSGPAQSWNAMCADCHSTNLRKNYLPQEKRYATQWSEINVACEACHGPGARHVAWANQKERAALPGYGLAVDLAGDGARWVMDAATGIARRDRPRRAHTEIDTCAPCHARRSEIHEAEPGRPLLDAYLPALLDDGLYYADGQMRDEVYEYGSFLQSKMYAAGVTCADCHDPHSLQLRGGPNEVCAQCHSVARFAQPSHHGHPPASGVGCVDCHMPVTTYMVVDARHEHAFRVPRPDLSTALGTPNVCNGCHGKETPAWAAAKIASWGGRAPAPGHFGAAFAAARRGDARGFSALLAVAADAAQPAIVRATAVSLFEQYAGREIAAPIRAAAADTDPLLRLAAARAADSIPAAARKTSIAALVADPLRGVRIEAARALAGVPRELFSASEARALDAALEEYRAAQRLDADRPGSYANLALLETALGQPARAEQLYRQAIDVGPYFIPGYLNLADLYRGLGRETEAEEALRAGLAQHPDSADLHHALGLLLVRTQRLPQALDELSAAADLAPDNARYAYVLGIALHSSGRSDEALAVLDRALVRHPGNAQILEALVGISRDSGRLDRAATYARQLQALMQP